MDQYRIMNILFRTVRECSTRLYSLPAVTRLAADELKSYGYTVTVAETARNARTLDVDGYRYRIIREKGWTRYDVIMA